MSVEETLPNLWRIPVPLPGNPLKELNSYLIMGKGENLLIDTGFRRAECRDALASQSSRDTAGALRIFRQ